MSYRDALEAAGAEVLEFEYFGEYSGSWFAKVAYGNEIGYVQGWYGSCTVCDAFQSEFYSEFDSEQSEEASQEKLAAFGKHYLETILPVEHYIKMYESGKYFSLEEEEVMHWLNGQLVTK